MKHLKIANFKAFRKLLSLNCPDEENVLIYGENGAGKSSLFDAFRLYYFRQEVYDERIAPNVVGPAREDEEQAVRDSFRHDFTTEQIVLEVDGESYITYHAENDEQVFLLSYANLHPRDRSADHINIREMIEHSYFRYETAINNWFDDEAEREIIDNTNKTLREVFRMNDVVLTRSQTGDGICTLERTGHVKKKKELLSHYFNEATLHVVRLIVFMECIAIERNSQKPSLMILDDCFNSLDAPNRTFMMRYLLEKTKGMQKVVMTHNLSYYNLMRHILGTEHGGEKWIRHILCMVDAQYELQNEQCYVTADDIIAKRKAGHYTDATQLGNAIRQAFEVDVYRLAMLCNMGAMPESYHLLNSLCIPNNKVYLAASDDYQAKTASELIDEIYRNVTNGNYYNLQQRLKEKIEKFMANDLLSPLIPALIELRLMQKVSLHQASHGHAGLPPVQSREFDVSLALLKKIEAAIGSVKREDLSTI